MTMTEQAKHANELDTEITITFLSRRYGAETDPTHTHELVMRADTGTECREYVFQTEKGRAAAHSMLSRIIAAQQLDEMLAMVFDAQLDVRTEDETEVHAVEEIDACATDGEYGSQF